MNTFGSRVKIRHEETGNVIGERATVISRITKNCLGGQFGSDRSKRLVASFVDGDVITLRPERTQRALSITAQDLYATLLRIQAQRGVLEKARAKKAHLAVSREARRIAAADRRIRQQARKDNGK